ncbi:hypothetical protein VO178_19425 [Lysinibacillus fusiformis]|uniref:hypothetical protein n=1 Tax=Lysinibacillus fusiformis TaxID=28031 RepID=UPI002D79D738|nr:hypothetical protein [Lysinibacillus fusiformis]WRS97526.1 hypothetical protein VO178_19425 [Lysinibacillus fusiformis]
MEYQINIEYADGQSSDHLTFRFENADIRNEVYQSICTIFYNDQVDSTYLVKNGGLTVSTYNYSEPRVNEMAQFVPNTSFKIEILNEIVNIIKEKVI